jgi:hypothetical protein
LQQDWQAGYNTLSDLGSCVLRPTSECISKFNTTVAEQHRKMEVERVLIEAATTELARAETKVTELGDLSKKVKGDPNGTPRRFQLRWNPA